MKMLTTTTSSMLTHSYLWDFVPFMLAGLLALLFTALLVLLVEDVEDREIQHKHTLQSVQVVTSPPPSPRIVGHAEKAWGDGSSIQPGSEHHGILPYPTPEQQRMFAKQLQFTANSARNDIASFFKQYRSSSSAAHKGLLASPTAATTQTSPILSMAKIIMHRHDQANKRPRRSKPGQPSPPPSPPAIQTQTTSFQRQQHNQLHYQPQYSPPPMRVQFPQAQLQMQMSPPPSPPLSPPYPYQRQRAQAHLRTPSVSHIQTQRYLPRQQAVC